MGIYLNNFMPKTISEIMEEFDQLELSFLDNEGKQINDIKSFIRTAMQAGFDATREGINEEFIEKTLRAIHRPYKFTDDYKNSKEQDEASKNALRLALAEQKEREDKFMGGDTK